MTERRARIRGDETATIAWVKPVPLPDALSQSYWDGAAHHELVIQRCARCGTLIHPPRAACRNCQGTDLEPSTVEPSGTVYSFTITYEAFVPGYEHDLPFILVLVALDIQPSVRIETILKDCAIDDVRIGLPVTLVFEEVAPGVTLPFAVPARPALDV
jgi:uncharacterized OB-fold protein